MNLFYLIYFFICFTFFTCSAFFLIEKRSRACNLPFNRVFLVSLYEVWEEPRRRACRRSRDNHFRYLDKRRVDVKRERNKAFPLNVTVYNDA